MKTTKTSLPKAQRGGCKYKQAKRVNARRKVMSEVGPKLAKIGAGVGAAAAGTIAYAKNAFGVKDKVKELMGQKKGGSVKTLAKKQNGGLTKSYPWGEKVELKDPMAESLRSQIMTPTRELAIPGANKNIKVSGKVKGPSALNQRAKQTKQSLKKQQKGGATYRDIDYRGVGIVKSEPRKIGKGTKETETRYVYGYAGPSSAEVIKRKYNKRGDLVRTKTKRTTPEKVDKYVAENESKIEYKRGGAVKKKTVTARKRK